MVSQNGNRGFLLDLLAKQEAKKAEIEATIQREIAEIDEKIAAIQTTLRLYDEYNENLSAAYASPISISKLRANANTQKEALEYIAMQSNGVVHYGDAKNLLISAGMAKGKGRNIASHLYRMMQQSDEWEKVAPGRFRYLKYKPTLFSQKPEAK